LPLQRHISCQGIHSVQKAQNIPGFGDPFCLSWKGLGNRPFSFFGIHFECTLKVSNEFKVIPLSKGSKGTKVKKEQKWVQLEQGPFSRAYLPNG